MKQKTYTNVMLPAEWYEQKAVMLTWAHKDTDWKPYLDDINKTLLSLTEVIAKEEKVLIVAQNKEEVWTLIKEHIAPERWNNISVFQCETNDTWARDHAFITLKATTKEGEIEPIYLDFQFNGWGKKFASAHDNAINAHLKEAKVLTGSWQDLTHFVLEGGSIESDGEGTIFTTSMCLLAPNRNQPLSKEEIEVKLLELLHAKRVVWLDYGSLVGDDTDGHIDTTVRVAPNNTLVFVGCEDENDEQYADFLSLKKQLQTLKTLSGEAYRLIELPMPTAIYCDDERLPATYANFLIINNVVILPTYNQPENDKKATEQLQKAFPEHRIVGVDARTVIKQHGSLHCLTMQIPCFAQLHI